MTTLTLTELVAAPVSDLTDTIWLNVRTEDDSVSRPAQVRRYAGGRDRIISRPGTTQLLTFTALNVDRDTYLRLSDLVGQLALFREPRGRAVYGVMQSVSGQEWQARETTLGSVSFTVQSVTHSEIV